MMSAAIEKGIQRGLEKGFAANADKIVDIVLSSMFRDQAYPMIVGGQLRLMEAGIKPLEAWRLSRAALIEMMKDEKVEFGHAGYTWDASAGRELVEEYCIAHFEANS